MILETAQLLSTAWHVCSPDSLSASYTCDDPHYPYKESVKMGPGLFYYIGNQKIYAKTHEHHPSAVWVREGRANYDWLWRLGMHLLEEYEYRYRRQHATRHVLRALELPPSLRDAPIEEPPTAMADEYVVTDAEGYVDAVASYRAYYLGAKVDLLKYTRRRPPEWIGTVARYVPVHDV